MQENITGVMIYSFLEAEELMFKLLQRASTSQESRIY